MTWQGASVVIGAIGSIIGLATLVRPIERIHIPNRMRAGLILAAGLLLGAIGLAWSRGHHCGCAPRPITACDPRASPPACFVRS
jgi:hypothetical protein